MSSTRGSVNPEYLRRNLLVAKAIGARIGSERTLARVRKLKRAPKWLVKALEEIHVRAAELPAPLVHYRSAVPAYLSTRR